MRMKNPFDDEPGDEEQEGAAETREPDSPDPEADRDEVTEASADDGDDAEDAEASGDNRAANISAPSIGPHTVIERRPPGERLDFDKISEVDALGRDKRREVVGGTYGPTRARVLATFATFFAVVAALAVGFYFLAKELDAPPSENPDVAPWSQPEAPQQPPKPIQ